MKERFTELLPFYVNGTLSEQDREWMDRYLGEHPTARSELAFFEALKTQIHDAVPKVPATIGLAKAMQLIRGDQPTISERLSAFFGSLGLLPAGSGRGGAGAGAGVFSFRPVMAMAFAVIVVQAGVIASMWRGQGAGDELLVRASRTAPAEQGPLLKVNFSPEAKEADIRFLLVGVQGTLTGGPGQLGDYFVQVPEGQQEAALKQIRSSAIVQAAEIAPGLPPRS